MSLEKVDVVFFIRHQLLKHVPRDIILGGMTVGRCFLIKRPRRHLRRQIAVEHLFDVLADVQRIEDLHVRETRQEI